MTHDMHPPGRGHRRGHGPEGRRLGGPESRHGRGQGRRRHRGHVRAAVLTLLAEEPMHGYQLMQTISERTNGSWTPSPGAIYPTLALLEDEGLVSVVESDGRKLAALTDAGHAHLAEHRSNWPDPFPSDEAQGENLRDLVQQVAEASRQVGRSGNPEQHAAAAQVLRETRRALYLLLADQD